MDLIVIVVLCLGILLLAGYLAFIKLQLRSINLQLYKRLTEHTRQPVSLGLLDKDLNRLAVNINNCLKEEENLRIGMIRKDKQFKEMVAYVSHDLRTPLTAIKGYQQLIEKGALSEDQRRKLKIAGKHADELGRLIEHFFEYSRLINTDAQPKPERLNFSNLTAECLAQSVPLFEEKHITVRFDEPGPVFIRADREMTIRIIRNLIRNCIQHSEQDVEVKLTAGQTAVLLFKNAVKDENIDCNRLFDQFYTANKARGGNTGLGLAIVKLFTERMGGIADAEMRDGYLSIRIKLPLFTES